MAKTKNTKMEKTTKAKTTKFRQYTHLAFRFITSPGNNKLPMWLICNDVLSNEAMKTSWLSSHLDTQH